MASRGRIPDDSFSASSEFKARYAAKYGRLNGTGAWEPKTTTDPDDYLQIDLLYEYVICAVATQGNPPTQSPTAQEWTTEYKLRFSLNGTTFFTYKENKTDKVGMVCLCIQVFTTAKITACGLKTTDFHFAKLQISFCKFKVQILILSHFTYYSKPLTMPSFDTLISLFV